MDLFQSETGHGVSIQTRTNPMIEKCLHIFISHLVIEVLRFSLEGVLYGNV